jgi:lipid II:glycine glycyltransferase (peptidoglycan interpeptide bridge formation enzyme)
LDLGAVREIKTTHVLWLAPQESEQSLLARYRKGHRNDVLKARREGVEVVLASAETEMDGYCRVYTQTVGRWARPAYIVYPANFFRSLHRLAESGERIRIWLARRGDELLAGVIVLVQGRHAAYWHAVSTDAGRSAHAGHLALHTAILDAVTLGVEMFDFMPSPGLTAVERFKAGFDANSMAVGVHRFPGSRPYRFLRWARRLSSK